jgi:hypothetical protein
MKVDMSPAAVTDRLQVLDELWELCVELMRAKPQKRETGGLSEGSLPESCHTLDQDRA